MILKRSWIALVWILSIALLLPQTSNAEAEQIDVYYLPLSLNFDGKVLAPPEDQQAFIYKNSTYVPMRFLTYALKQGIDWDNETSTATVRTPMDYEQDLIDQYYEEHVSVGSMITEEKPVRTSITAYFKPMQYRFYGQEMKPQGHLPGFIINNRLYVPMRFFSESSGAEIHYDQKTYTIKANPDHIGNLDFMKLPEEAATDAEQTADTPTPTDSGSPGTPPSYNQIIHDVEASIASLKASCETQLMDLAKSYLFESDAAKKAQLIDQGYAILNSCDEKFKSLMTQTENKLTQNNYETNKLDTYRELYAEEKQMAKEIAGEYR